MTHEKIALGAGRFDADDDAVQARCARAMTEASMYLSTEVMHNQRNAFWATGAHRLFISEFAVLYDPGVWEPLGPAKVNWLTRHVSFSRGHIRVRPRAGSFLFRHTPTGRVGYFDVNHLPAHIQHGDEFTSDPRHADEVLAHKRAVHHAGSQAQGRKKSHPDRFQFWCGDVNLDQHVERWRTYMRNRLTMFGVYDDDRPASGDLGARLITAAWTWGTHEEYGRVLPKDPAEHGLDHRLTLISLDL